MKNYKKIIISSKETVREAFNRLSYLPSIPTTKIASYYKDEQSYIIFNFDKDTDKMTVQKNGEIIFESAGEDIWNKTVEHMKRLIHRRVLDPISRFFMKTESGNFVDITQEIRAV